MAARAKVRGGCAILDARSRLARWLGIRASSGEGYLSGCGQQIAKRHRKTTFLKIGAFDSAARELLEALELPDAHRAALIGRL